jgi:hypothetical protein
MSKDKKRKGLPHEGVFFRFGRDSIRLRDIIYPFKCRGLQGQSAFNYFDNVV